MDQKLRNLKRLAGSDPLKKDQYIRELERLVGMGQAPEEGRLKCLVDNCTNHAHQGGGNYLIMQSNVNHIGEPPYSWDNAVGPLFICGPCFRQAKKQKDRPFNGLIGYTGI